MKKIGIYVLMFAILVALSACKVQAKPIFEKDDLGLASVQSYENLKTLINQSRKTNETLFDSLFRNTTAVPEVAVDAMQKSDGETSHSKTNVQVDGVDEGDVIKTDGKRIYRIRYNELQVIELLGQGQMKIVLTESMDSTVEDHQYTYFSDLYLTSQYLVVIGQRYTYFTLRLDGEMSDQSPDAKTDFGWYWYGFAQSVVMVYDLKTLDKVETFEIHGNILTSRLIEENLYLISSQYVVMDDKIDPRPIFKQGEEVIVPTYQQIKFLPNTSLDSYTIITRINLSQKPDMEFDIYLGASSWGQIYVSLNAIYFASNTYTFNRTTQDYVSIGTLISYMFNPDGSVVYGGAGDFEGYVINQFAMDEYEGNIRIVTTDGWGDSVKNRLYVFERTILDGKRVLKQIALIDEGLGKPRERVQSVRFNGPLATVVTFEMTDPFYTIDLTNPKNPIIRAGLEVTGFSTYQHPWFNQTVIGIGYEADDNGRILGIKLALYDVSDWDNPVEIGKPLVLLNGDNGWIYSEALHNHKAILINEERGFIGFAMQKSYWTIQTYELASEYMIFSIDPLREQPIQIDASVGHMDLYLANRAYYQNLYRYSYDFSVERAVYIGDYLYVISGEAISSHDMNRSFERISILQFHS